MQNDAYKQSMNAERSHELNLCNSIPIDKLQSSRFDWQMYGAAAKQVTDGSAYNFLIAHICRIQDTHIQDMLATAVISHMQRSSGQRCGQIKNNCRPACELNMECRHDEKQ